MKKAFILGAAMADILFRVGLCPGRQYPQGAASEAVRLAVIDDLAIGKATGKPKFQPRSTKLKAAMAQQFETALKQGSLKWRAG
ncbi:hypothetical protein [Pseudomonas sp. H2_E05]